jgi:hypothetical protein
VFLRGPGAAVHGGPPQMAANASLPDVGVWRAGRVNNADFLLGEALVPGGQTPQALLLSKALVFRYASMNTGTVRLRFEANGHQYTFGAYGQPAFRVNDDRYSAGTSIGVWSDQTAIRVSDFRLYALAE